MTLKFKIITHQNIQTFEEEVNNFLNKDEIVIIPESIKTEFIKDKYVYSIHYYYKEEYNKALQQMQQVKQTKQINAPQPTALES